MLRIASLTILLLLSCLSQANQPSKLYQIDMIVFTHQHSSSQPAEQSSTPLLPPTTQHAIPIQDAISGTRAPYHLLASSASQLNQEYWALTHKADYQIIAHYTWLQPSNNQRAVVIPVTHRNGWTIEGTLRMRQSNYYLLDTELLFSTPNSARTAFLFSQKQRLKPGTVYYLDHPQAGMLIKVHQVV
ncbi:MAG TPA: hypothetical protein DDY37_05020 [Legionella sp.]|nr:hypothetical protein [Legionella sp.]